MQGLFDALDRKKQVLRSLNRAGQSLIRQIDDPDTIDTELDKISDQFYVVVDKVKNKKDQTKDTVARVEQLLEVIIEIEIWIEETYMRLDRLENPASDPSHLKAQLEEVQVSRLTIANLTFPVEKYKIPSLYIAYSLTSFR